MTNTNDVQMGGDHYQGKSKSGQQHWDVAYDFNFDTGQYNVTKYVMRHEYKNGFEDLAKCYHHLIKYMEVSYPEQMSKFATLGITRVVPSQLMSFDDGSSILKLSQHVDITNGRRAIRCTPAELMNFIDQPAKPASALFDIGVTLSRNEADLVSRVLEAGKITVLRPEDDAVRIELTRRLKEFFTAS